VNELRQALLKRVAVEAGELEIELARKRVEKNLGKE